MSIEALKRIAMRIQMTFYSVLEGSNGLVGGGLNNFRNLDGKEEREESAEGLASSGNVVLNDGNGQVVVV